jgi:hypothetical protein
VSIARILADVKTDFIYAPHINLIYARAQDELKQLLLGELSSGHYMPGLPFSMEVPKSFRIPVETSKRLGPSYSRPGSILNPKDRLFYQALADRAAKIIDGALDKNRSFSHQLADDGSEAMFVSTRKCWNDLQKALSKHAQVESHAYVLKADIANYFGAINLHTLVNVLDDSGLVSDTTLMDWQRMWLVAALLQSDLAPDDEVKIIMKIAQNGNSHDALVATAAYYVGRFGDHARRKSLQQLYAQVSQYVQAAIYASSRFWPGAERANAKAMWAGHSPLHALLTEAMKK